MALKGTAKIELTNTKTGEVEIIEHNNMLTNATAKILSYKGVPLAYYATQRAEIDSYTKSTLPIVPNVIGGILLVDGVLEESTDNVMLPPETALVGYANDKVNSKTDIRRGSINLSESGPLEDSQGYKFVFDFGTNQANGTISAVALTSPQAGACGRGSSVYIDLDEMPWFIVSQSLPVEINVLPAGSLHRALRCLVYTSIDNQLGYAVYVNRESTYTTIDIVQLDMFYDTIGILDSLNPSSAKIESVHQISPSSFISRVTSSSYYYYYTFLYDDSGFIWGFTNATSSNESISTEGVTLNWLKISLKDFSFTEGTWTLPINYWRLGRNIHQEPVTVSQYINTAWVISSGYLYIPQYNRKGVYKVNLSNVSDIKHIETELTLPEFTTYNNASMAITMGGRVYYSNCYIENDTIVPAVQLNLQSDSYYSYGLFSTANVITDSIYTANILTYTSNSKYYLKGLYYRLNTYLATINNLDTPVQKTADKTMKITYILREDTTS